MFCLFTDCHNPWAFLRQEMHLLLPLHVEDRQCCYPPCLIKMLSVRNWQLQWDNHNKAAAFEPEFFASKFYKTPISALSVCCRFFNEFSGNMSLHNSRFFKVEKQNFCIIHLLLILLMNLAEKLLCRIFTFRFCKSQSWHAEYLHYIFVIVFSMNLAEI